MLYSNLSVVMIAKNEEKAISTVVSEILEVLPGAEVIVVDGSDDNTASVASKAGAIVHREPPQGGYGPALHKAIFVSKREFIATVDADHTYSPDDIKRLYKYIEMGYDIVGGTRIGNGKPKSMPLLNYLANRAMSSLAAIMFIKKISDIHSGLRIYRNAKLSEIKWDYPDYGFTVELLLVPLARGFRIKEIPITYRTRIGESQLMKVKSLKATFKSIYRARFKSYKFNK